MTATIQLPLTVCLSESISQGVLAHMEDAGELVPEAVNRFVEDAVQARLFDLNVEKIKSAFSDMSAEEIDELVDEAVTWARSPEGRACE